MKLPLYCVVAFGTVGVLSSACGPRCSTSPQQISTAHGVAFTAQLQNVRALVHTTTRWGEERRKLSPNGDQLSEREIALFEAPAESIAFACDEGLVTEGPEVALGRTCQVLAMNPVPLQVQVELTAANGERLLTPSEGFVELVVTTGYDGDNDECSNRWPVARVTIDTEGFDSDDAF